MKFAEWFLLLSSLSHWRQSWEWKTPFRASYPLPFLSHSFQSPFLTLSGFQFLYILFIYYSTSVIISTLSFSLPNSFWFPDYNSFFEFFFLFLFTTLNQFSLPPLHHPLSLSLSLSVFLSSSSFHPPPLRVSNYFKLSIQLVISSFLLDLSLGNTFFFFFNLSTVSHKVLKSIELKWMFSSLSCKYLTLATLYHLSCDLDRKSVV